MASFVDPSAKEMLVGMGFTEEKSTLLSHCVNSKIIGIMASFVDPSAKEMLVGMGFTEEKSTEALQAANGNVELAAEYCLNGIPEPQGGNPDSMNDEFETGYLRHAVGNLTLESAESFSNYTEEQLMQELGELEVTPTLLKLLESFDAAAVDGGMNSQTFRNFVAQQIQDMLIPFLEEQLSAVLTSVEQGLEIKVIEHEEGGENHEFKQLVRDVVTHSELLGPVISAGLFRLFDKEDHNGIVSRHEFLQTLVSFAHFYETQNFVAVGKTLFELIDANDNGRVELMEMADFILDILSIPFSFFRPVVLALDTALESPVVDKCIEELAKRLGKDTFDYSDIRENLEPVIEKLRCIVSSYSEANPELKEGARKIRDQFTTEFSEAATDGELPKDTAVDLYTRITHNIMKGVLASVRPQMNEVVQQLSEAAPYNTEEVEPVLQASMNTLLALLKGPAVRRFIEATMLLLDNNDNGMIKESDIQVLFLSDCDDDDFHANIATLVKLFDGDGDGKITKAELKNVAHKIVKIMVEYASFVVEMLKEVLGAIKVPLLGLISGVVGDGTSFSFEEILALFGGDSSSLDMSAISAVAQESMRNLPFM
eukprot:CAMPEP_0117872134 /NCGR_PEP_ID=MMETSP0950-20121206/10903_1 /TAXON_ID=44440 /ORGANISM="Chattonella subsalsa, Strain CCMP2191" /LENGTH=596 /DNA_ID=CAMNT_0005724851 /DNA_START=66 /DNA_END=1856 /DNA_ORIENTATION=-